MNELNSIVWKIINSKEFKNTCTLKLFNTILFVKYFFKHHRDNVLYEPLLYIEHQQHSLFLYFRYIMCFMNHCFKLNCRDVLEWVEGSNHAGGHRIAWSTVRSPQDEPQRPAPEKWGQARNRCEWGLPRGAPGVWMAGPSAHPTNERCHHAGTSQQRH